MPASCQNILLLCLQHLEDPLIQVNNWYWTVLDYNNAASFLGAKTVFDHLPLLRTFFQETNNDIRVTKESKMKHHFEKWPDPCSILKRQGQIDRQDAGVAVSCDLSKWQLGFAKHSFVHVQVLRETWFDIFWFVTLGRPYFGHSHYCHNRDFFCGRFIKPLCNQYYPGKFRKQFGCCCSPCCWNYCTKKCHHHNNCKGIIFSR